MYLSITSELTQLVTYNYPTTVKGFGRAGPSQILAGSGLGARPMLGYKAQIETPVRKPNWTRGWNNKENYSGAGRISHPKKPQLIKKSTLASKATNPQPITSRVEEGRKLAW